MLSSDQIRWCVNLVRNSPTHIVGDVSGVCDALDYAHNRLVTLTLAETINLANLISVSTRSLRQTSSDDRPDYTQVPSLTQQLLDAWNAKRINPNEFYWEFMAIRPFTKEVTEWLGWILWNWCSRTTGRPIAPPQFLNETSTASRNST